MRNRVYDLTVAGAPRPCQRTESRIAVGLVILVLVSSGAAAETWQRVSVPDTPVAVGRLINEGADFEGSVRRDGRVWLFAEAAEALGWRGLGVDLRVEVEDVEAAYAKRLAAAPAEPGEFAEGSMGGNFTYSEVVTKMEEYRAGRPEIVGVQTKIGSSIQRRAVWAYKISDNPSKTEGEPRVLLTGLTHAREPQGMMSLLYFVRDLVESYGSDPRATWLVNSREIWVVPVVNPDGYVYNEQKAPSGGGMHRKNMRVNSDGSSGVDLNRNFGYMWGYNDEGSSPQPRSEVYRGTGPFSEPETTALKKFCEKQKFGTALNLHSFGNYLIHPWGYTESIPEPTLMPWLGGLLAKHNQFLVGTGYTTVGYPTNGDADDYMYGARGVLAFTPEVGGDDDGFWPDRAQIEPLAQLTLEMLQTAAAAAGGFAAIDSSTISGDGTLHAGRNATLRLTVSTCDPAGTTFGVAVRVYSNDSRVVVTTGSSFSLSAGSSVSARTRVVGVRGGTITKSARVPIKVAFAAQGRVLSTQTVQVPVAP
ncbi:MAG: M14 family metallopeptidase [Acidobacteriota bacterium]